MSKLVVFEIGEGDFNERGFPITLRIGEEGKHSSVSIPGKLPPNPDILKNLNSLRSAYLKLENLYRLSKKQEQPSGGSFLNDYKREANVLKNSFNDWLSSDELQSIREKFIQNVKASDEMQLLVKTDNLQIQRLPWNLWNLFESYTKAEVTFIPCAYEATGKTPVKPKVRILAIIGDSTGINTQADVSLLKEQLPDTEAEIEFLPKPNRQELTEHLWSEKGWDILYFAGHSSSELNGENGWIKINQNEDLSIKDLKQSLKKAVENGLKLAIFNSCDGLGLASSLRELCIPNIIVMREPVPDKVSQAFLKYFLEAFYRGSLLDSAVKEARGKLEGLENEFPCASWLPVLYKTSQEAPPSWKDWIEDKTQNPRFSLKLRDVFAISLAVASMVVGARWLGKLHPMELSAYDQLTRLRAIVEEPKPDERILVITIDRDDVDLQNRNPDYAASSLKTLSDPTWNQLFKKLGKYKPQVIGMNLFREGTVDPKKYPDFAFNLKSGRVVGICFEPGGGDDTVGKASTNLPDKNLGFVAGILDEPNKNEVIRRHYLWSYELENPEICRNKELGSFSFKLALNYLESKGFKHQIGKDYIKIGNTVFSRLKKRVAGYNNVKIDDTSDGIQTILNYRPYKNYKTDIAKTITLTDFLYKDIFKGYVDGHIVLIGNIMQGDNYRSRTPYNIDDDTPHILLHAQAISHILDVVEGKRSQIWAWDWWMDSLWIWVWSSIGGTLVCFVGWQRGLEKQFLLIVILSNITAYLILYILCFGFLVTLGIWIPLFPSAMALFFTSAILTSMTLGTKVQR